MKKVFIIHAHPEQKSFCSSLRMHAKQHFTSKGYEVKESDLYKMGFNPVGGATDFTSVNNPDFFKYQMEQVNAHTNNLFVPDLKMEMEKLEWCDILIFNFPLWWFGLPAILKGWVDRVFAMGVVYGNGKGVYENGTYKNKLAFITMTTGGPEIAYNGGKNGELDTILFPIQHGMFYFVGMTVLPPFISFSPARKSDPELKAELDRYSDYLNSLDILSPIYKAS
ncbi:MAG: NAD(P)H-dependent oxidoreductase [Bacteroidetes bacterium]|nr:NAD(P)H-dependent oxidoreductase [Bacteroidota bacterium]